MEAFRQQQKTFRQLHFQEMFPYVYYQPNKSRDIKNCIIILGSPNDDQGNLGPMALSRLKAALALYVKEKSLVLCTGGFGAGFNNTEHPHATYAKKFLQENGVEQLDFLAPALSSNTVEDAILSLKSIEGLRISGVTVVTSDYHMPRVKFIFTKLFKNYQIQFFSSASSYLDKPTKNRLVAHESKALKELEEKGLIIDGKAVQ